MIIYIIIRLIGFSQIFKITFIFYSIPNTRLTYRHKRQAFRGSPIVGQQNKSFGSIHTSQSNQFVGMSSFTNNKCPLVAG